MLNLVNSQWNITIYKVSGWTIGALAKLSSVIYDMTVGPVCYVILPEISSLRQRIKTAALARAVYDISGFPLGTLFNYMINPANWNWGGKIGYWYGGLATLGFIYTFYRVPESKGRTYAELDLLFE